MQRIVCVECYNPHPLPGEDMPRPKKNQLFRTPRQLYRHVAQQHPDKKRYLQLVKTAFERSREALRRAR